MAGELESTYARYDSQVLGVLDIIAFAGFFAAVIAFPFMAVGFIKASIRQRKARFSTERAAIPLPIKSILFFITPVFISIGATELETTIARNDLLSFLQQQTARIEVFVNQTPVQNGSEIVTALTQLRTMFVAHHSHPTHTVMVELRDADKRIVLDVRRDSDLPQEYRVFYPLSRLTSSNDIGRITTPLFDGY